MKYTLATETCQVEPMMWHTEQDGAQTISKAVWSWYSADCRMCGSRLQVIPEADPVLVVSQVATVDTLVQAVAVQVCTKWVGPQSKPHTKVVTDIQDM
jgi:hypothetical protein